MNKPLKLLLVVGVLAFAAAGLYYAMVAPARTGKVAANPPRQNQSGGVVFNDGNPRPPSEIRTAPAAAAPIGQPLDKPADRTDSAPSSGAVAGSSSTTSAPAGFSPVAEPMKPLPNELPGFSPVQADGSPAKPAAAAPVPTGATAPATPAATTPGAPTSTAPASVASKTAPVGAAPTTPSSTATPPAAPAPLPPLPAPAKPAVATSTPAPAKPAAPSTYTVKEGDSIASIWRSISGSERGWEKLLAANPGVDPSRLKIGQVLKVPDAGAATTAASAAPAKAPTGAGSYTVESGDTLSRVAAKTLGDSKRWKEIFEANREALGNDPGSLQVGQVLKIPGKSAGATPSVKAPTGSPAPR